MEMTKRENAIAALRSLLDLHNSETALGEKLRGMTPADRARWGEGHVRTTAYGYRLDDKEFTTVLDEAIDGPTGGIRITPAALAELIADLETQ